VQKNINVYTGIIIVLLIVIISLVFVNSYVHHNATLEHLQGLWIADEKFCEESGIDGMILYVGESEGGSCGAYMIMHSNNTIIMEKKISIDMSRIPQLIIGFPSIVRKTIELVDSDAEDNDKPINALHVENISDVHISKIMPPILTMEIDIVHGCMSWKDDETIYAKMYKDNQATAFS